VLLDELAQPGADAPAVQFADFAAWQRSTWNRQGPAAALAALGDGLRGWPPALELPADRPRPRYPSYRGARLPVCLGPGVAARVRTLASECLATPYMVLLTAFGLFLQRRSGQDRIAVGCPVANRGAAELERLVGLCANTVVIPLDLCGRPPFRELVARTREACVRVHDRQAVPFEQLVQTLNPPRDLSRNPVFQVAFAMQNTTRSGVSAGGLDWSLEWLDLGTSKFDLLLDLSDDGHTFQGHVEYSADLWSRAGAERLRDDLIATIETATA
jgi:non-ribosomal peptide synthetase component F